MATLYTATKAEELVAILREEEALASEAHEAWSYTAIHAPDSDGLSCIEVRDEEGLFVGTL